MNSIPFKRLDDALFRTVAAQARDHERLRMNHNLHREQDTVQRFLNVLQPGTYVRPHRHQRHGSGSGFECFLVLQGAIGLLLFDADGTVKQTERLDAGGPTIGIELAEGQSHSLVALKQDTVIFELKQGPYDPIGDKEFLPGFPQEETAEAKTLERRWRTMF